MPVDGAAVEYLDDHFHVVGAEEPEIAGISRQEQRPLKRAPYFLKSVYVDHPVNIAPERHSG